VGAVVGLAALIALAEIGLRIQALTAPPIAKSSRLPTPAAVPSWTTGWQLRPSSRVTIRPDDGEPFVFRTNRWGLRGGEVEVPKPADVYRILCLGDACLVGTNCPEPQSFVVQLQTTLQSRFPVEVINAGLPLGGPSLAVIRTEQLIAALQPDAVLLVTDAQDVLQDIALRKWIARDRQGQPVSCAHPEATPARTPNLVARLRDEFRLVDWGWTRLSQEWSSETADQDQKVRRGAELPRDQLPRALQPLQHLQQLCESHHAELLIVATPARGELFCETEASPARLTDAAFFSGLGEFLKQSRVVGIDATSVFKATAESDHSDWTIREHQALAAWVAQGIQERLPGPWSSPYDRPNAVTPAAHRVAVPPLRR